MYKSICRFMLCMLCACTLTAAAQTQIRNGRIYYPAANRPVVQTGPAQNSALPHGMQRPQRQPLAPGNGYAPPAKPIQFREFQENRNIGSPGSPEFFEHMH